MAPLLVLQLPEATPSNNVIKGMHYRVYQKERQAWQKRVIAALQGQAPVKVKRCLLRIERYSAGGGLDWDNAYGGLKPLLDCLVSPSTRNPDGLGLMHDDSPAFMPWAPVLTQHPAKRSEGRTVVSLYDADQITPAELWRAMEH